MYLYCVFAYVYAQYTTVTHLEIYEVFRPFLPEIFVLREKFFLDAPQLRRFSLFDRHHVFKKVLYDEPL